MYNEATMAHSFARVHLHLVFSTKNRIPLLKDRDLRTRVHRYLAGACKNLEVGPATVGGVADHVHLACRLSRTRTIAELLRDLKRESSRWLQQHIADFGWQEGYGAFSISPSHLPALKTYILEQEAHHHKESFKEEFLRLLEKYEVGYDERYVFD